MSVVLPTVAKVSCLVKNNQLEKKTIRFNYAVSLTLGLISIVLFLVGLTLTPISQTVIDNTSYAYSESSEISTFFSYVKVLISGGYYLVVPMWIPRVLVMLGAIILYISAIFLIFRKSGSPMKRVLSKKYWSDYTRIN